MHVALVFQRLQVFGVGMPCVSGQTQTIQNQSAKRANGGIRTPADVTHISFRHCDLWLSLLPDIAFGFSNVRCGRWKS